MCSEENKNQQKHAKLTSELLEFMQSKINQNFSDNKYSSLLLNTS